MLSARTAKAAATAASSRRPDLVPPARFARQGLTPMPAAYIRLGAYRTRVRVSRRRKKVCTSSPEVLGSAQRPPLRIGEDTKLTDQLTERQNKILDYIRYVTKVRNYPPSVREIGEAVGLSSSSTVHHHLHQLEPRGRVQPRTQQTP